MVFVLSLVYTTLALLASTAAAAPASSDWKYALGWDGVVANPTSIGTPLNEGAHDLETRAADTVGGIFLCSELNWQGTCGYAVQPLNTCIVLGTDWNNKISSLGPDPGTRVVIYDGSNCVADPHSAIPSIEFPGSADLGDWNDRISSFIAFAA